MKILHVGAAVLAVASFIAPATAQEASSAVVAPVSAPQIQLVTDPQQNIVRAGAEVALITREELTTKKKLLRVGQRVQLEVASSISANGMVVVPIGTPAVGEVTEVRNKGMWGKSGYIAVRIISMRLGDRTIRLSGTFDDKGVTGTGGVVAAVALIPIAGFFTTGTSAMIPTGSAVKGFLEEDILFQPSAVVPVAVPVTEVAAPAVEAPIQ